MNSYFKFTGKLVSAVILLSFLMPPAVAGVQCYSRDSYSKNFISAVQKELKAKGFYSGPVNGHWGPKTERGLDEFKARRVSGSYTIGLDANTLRALFGPDADPEKYGLSPNTKLPPDIFKTSCR